MSDLALQARGYGRWDLGTLGPRWALGWMVGFGMDAVLWPPTRGFGMGISHGVIIVVTAGFPSVESTMGDHVMIHGHTHCVTIFLLIGVAARPLSPRRWWQPVVAITCTRTAWSAFCWRVWLRQSSATFWNVCMHGCALRRDVALCRLAHVRSCWGYPFLPSSSVSWLIARIELSRPPSGHQGLRCCYVVSLVFDYALLLFSETRLSLHDGRFSFLFLNLFFVCFRILISA